MFSGFYEEDALTSNHNSPLSSGLRRTASLGPTAVLSPVNNNNTNFFVKRGEWKHLHLPENVRNSILERSNAITNELNQLAESSLDNNTVHSDLTVNTNTSNKQISASSGDISLKEVNKSNLSSLDQSVVSSTVDKKVSFI